MASTDLKFIAQDAMTETYTTIIMVANNNRSLLYNTPTCFFYIVAFTTTNKFSQVNTPHNLPAL